MGRTGSLTLIVSSLFLAVVALLLNSPGLFYMGTALIAMFAAAKIQAYLAVRGLVIQRTMPETVQVGEPVTILLNVASTKAIQRPLVWIQDLFPRHMRAIELRPSLPIAPAFEKFITTSYIIRPRRRGIFRWDDAEINSTDALGLTSSKTTLKTESCVLKVYPKPVKVPIPMLYSSGQDENGTGLRQASSGLQIRSVRQYVNSDPVKHIHWKSTAKTGQLMVKEFEVETSQACQLIIQHLAKAENSKSDGTSIDLVCGMALYVSQHIIEDQISFSLNNLDPEVTHSSGLTVARKNAVRNFLVEIEPKIDGAVSKYLSIDAGNKPSVRFIFMSIAEPEILSMIRESDIQTIVYVLGKCNELSHLPESECAYNSYYLQDLHMSGAQAIVVNLTETI